MSTIYYRIKINGHPNYIWLTEALLIEFGRPLILYVVDTPDTYLLQIANSSNDAGKFLFF